MNVTLAVSIIAVVVNGANVDVNKVLLTDVLVKLVVVVTALVFGAINCCKLMSIACISGDAICATKNVWHLTRFECKSKRDDFEDEKHN